MITMVESWLLLQRLSYLWVILYMPFVLCTVETLPRCIPAALTCKLLHYEDKGHIALKHYAVLKGANLGAPPATVGLES